MSVGRSHDERHHLMADPFLTLNGASLERLTRADDNLLDADTAHIQQSIGQWSSHNAATNLQVSSGIPAPFGQTLLAFDSAGATPAQVITATGVDALETGAGDAVLTVDVANPTGGRVDLACVIYDNAGATKAEFTLDFQETTTPDQLVTLSAVRSMNAGDRIALLARFTATNVGQTGYLARAMIASPGAVTTFVPSLFVVGVLDYRFDVATVWDPVSDLATAYYNPPAGSGPPLCNLRTATRFGMEHAGSLFTSLTHGFTGSSRRSIRILADPAFGFTVQEDTGAGFQLVVDGGAPWSPVPASGFLSLFARALGGSQFNLAADVYDVALRDGEDGPVVYRMDPADVLASVI